MSKTITLTDQEAKLRQLLLDVSEYIGTLDGHAKPVLRITGGWVRDKLLGSHSMDVDVGINTMTGLDFGNLMKQYLDRPETQNKYDQSMLGRLAKIEANPEKSKHLETVTTRILGLEVDLVNLRKETYTEDSRTPTMEFGTAEEDALRRDATINALFYNLTTGEVEDFTGRGLQDMERKVIKTPLAPVQTFKDDPLRVLRCIRFASRLGYQIAEEDEQAMINSDIKNELKRKISRERVGVEITKMMKGPHPHTALCLIDRLGLYDDIFTNPTDPEWVSVCTTQWKRAYDQLLEITRASLAGAQSSTSLGKISSVLLRDEDDTFSAWMLACFVPFAEIAARTPESSKSKRLSHPAILAAREGIKADNKIRTIVDNAISQREEIFRIKDEASSSRESQGQAIRRWGTNWRSSVLYALLTEVTRTESLTEKQSVLDDYARWLSNLQVLDLLDVNRLKPIVNGNQLSKALGMKDGPWMKKALDIAMEWQLRNPEETDPAGGIAEVVERKEELGIA